MPTAPTHQPVTDEVSRRLYTKAAAQACATAPLMHELVVKREGVVARRTWVRGAANDERRVAGRRWGRGSA